MNNIFYVYCLIDSKTNMPFYIGKGHGNRMYNHEKSVEKSKIPNNNKYLFNKIKKIKNSGYNILYKKILENVDESTALKEEISQIKFFGRNNMGTGILCNLTDGGDGIKNLSDESRNKLKYKKSDSHRKKLSESHMGKKLSEEHILNLKNRNYLWNIGKKRNKETIKKLSLQKKGKTWEEIYGIDGANKKRKELELRHINGFCKGKNNGMYGKKHSAETRKIMSDKKRNCVEKKNEINR